MARLARLYVPEQPQHVILRASAGAARGAFGDDDDYLYFLDTLKHAARDCGLAVHAYVLMPTRVQLLATPRDAASLPGAMQALGRRYVAHYNRRHGASGALWDGRYRATVLDGARFLLICSRAIETQPVVQRLAQGVEGYRWSSYRHHVGLAVDGLITDHPIYWAMGNTPFERQHRYREWCEQFPDAATLDALEEATLKGWVLGDAAFHEHCRRAANRRVAPLARGRPRKMPGS